MLCNTLRYKMIRSIRHKGLKRLYEADDQRALVAEQVVKLRDILARLDAARSANDMDVPGFGLHPLKGDRKGFLGCNSPCKLAGDFSVCRP